jgi:hypothetical protein
VEHTAGRMQDRGPLRPNAIVSGSTVVQFDVIDEGAFERGDRECSPCSRGAMPTLEGWGRGGIERRSNADRVAYRLLGRDMGMLF